MNQSTYPKTEVMLTISIYINPKLEQHFPNDPFSDITIIFANKNYKLQKAYLRLESDYFSENFEAENVCKSGLLLIGKKFDVNLFDKILRCFYGGKACIYTNEIYTAFEICQYLKCASLFGQMIEQIVKNFENLNFFMVYSIGFLYSNKELLEKCFAFLKETNFKILLEEWVYSSKPANKYPTTIYSLSEESFKNLIKMHNQAKINSSRQSCLLNYYEIYNVIRNYVNHNVNKADQVLKLKEMIVDLIDKNQLNAKEYKSIYHQDLFLVEEEKNNNNVEYSNKNESQKFNKTGDSSKIDVITSENFLFRKEMEELRNENAVLLEELKVLKENFQKSQHNLAQYEEKYNDLSTKFQEIKNDFNNNYIKNEMRFYETEMIIEELKQELLILSKNHQETNNFHRTFSEKTSAYSNKFKRNSANINRFNHPPLFRKSTEETKASKSDAMSFCSKDVRKNATIMKQVLKNSEIDEDNEMLKHSISNESFVVEKRKRESATPTYSILKQKTSDNVNHEEKGDIEKFIKKIDENINRNSQPNANLEKNSGVSKRISATEAQNNEKNLENLMKNICIDAKQDEFTQESFFLLEKNGQNLNNTITSNCNYSQIIPPNLLISNINYEINYKNTIMFDIPSDFLKEDSDFETLKKWFDIKLYQKLKLHLLYKGSKELFSAALFKEKLEGIKPYIVFFSTKERENFIFGGFSGHSEQEFAFEIKRKIRIDYVRKENCEDSQLLISFGDTFRVFKAPQNDFFEVDVVISEEDAFAEKACLKVKEIEVFQILIDSEMEI